MFDIKIIEVNYHYSRNCAGECPIVKATIHIRDEYTHMVPIKRTWVFDVLSYANRYEGGKRVEAIDSIIEELVKKMWTALHIPAPKERVVLIDMYLPEPADTFDMSYMNELFTKYLEYERFRDNYARMLCNSRFGIISHDMHHMYPLPIIPESSPLYGKDMKQTFIDETLLDTDLADSIMDTCRYFDNICLEYRKEKAKEKIKEYEKMQIENVIFNDPATIVFWRDGSKTVVKAQNEPFDKEKGLAMAIAKKVYGNEGSEEKNE